MSITLKEIAAKAGVTARVVSAVANDDFSRIRVGAEKKKKISALLTKYNYSPNEVARVLKSKRTRIFNVIIPSATFFQTHQYSSIITGLQFYAESIGFRVKFTSLSEGYKDYKSLNGVIADGIVFFYWGEDHDPVVIEILKLQLPVLTALGRCVLPGVHNLYQNNETAMYTLTRKLIDSGHSRLAYAPQYRVDLYHKDGWAGVLRAVAEKSGTEIKEYISQNKIGSFTGPEDLHVMGSGQMKDILNDPFGATAVICTEDPAAMGAIAFAQSKGVRVPEDMAVSGNGNSPFSSIWNPGITSVDIRAMEYGEELGRILHEVIAGETQGVVKKAFDIGPVFRESTGVQKNV